MQSVFCPRSEIWGIFAWFQTFAQRKGVVAPLERLFASQLLQQSACLSEVMPFLPLRFLLLDVTLGHGHSQYVVLSISISAALLLYQWPSFCVNVAAFASKKGAHVLISHACMFYMCLRFCSSLLLHCHLSICYLPKPEAPVSFWEPTRR